ncbi:hypothetical protein NT6N_12480 [Oceaniferula spumae]|uniref:Type II secretion system protein n=1 Tax=Oceaniferula spumae TaxID=2979115 RepID=A0AAT9FJR1_9BACT
MKYSGNKTKRGFTLVETVIAMGIITIMITAFLAAFGPAVQGIRKAISAKEANRMATTLESELSILRPDEAGSTGYKTAFEKAFTWIEESGGTTKDNMVLIYQYRGDPGSVREDGSLEPYTNSDGIPGEDYVIQSVVRRLGDSEVSEELTPGVVEGRVFYVRMTQLIFNGAGELIVSDEPGKIREPRVPNGTKDYATYPEAVIAFQAQFYVLKSSLQPYIANTFDPNDPGKPVFTRNMAVRR